MDKLLKQLEDFEKAVKRLMEALKLTQEKKHTEFYRELFKNGYVEEEEVKELLQMVDDRNLTSHTYNEDIAEHLFKKLEVYANLMRVAVEKLKRNLV